MDWGLIANWAIFVVTAVGVVVALYTYDKSRKTSIFLAYTERYHEIMSAELLAKWRLKMDAPYEPPLDAKEHEKLRIAALEYFNLCAEEYCLKNKNWLDKAVWNIWDDEMERTLGTPLFRDEWKSLKDEFKSYKEFQDYIDGIHKRQ
jgi:hypothetical protein